MCSHPPTRVVAAVQQRCPADATQACWPLASPSHPYFSTYSPRSPLPRPNPAGRWCCCGPDSAPGPTLWPSQESRQARLPRQQQSAGGTPGWMRGRTATHGGWSACAQLLGNGGFEHTHRLLTAGLPAAPAPPASLPQFYEVDSRPALQRKKQLLDEVLPGWRHAALRPRFAEGKRRWDGGWRGNTIVCSAAAGQHYSMQCSGGACNHVRPCVIVPHAHTADLLPLLAPTAPCSRFWQRLLPQAAADGANRSGVRPFGALLRGGRGAAALPEPGGWMGGPIKRWDSWTRCGAPAGCLGLPHTMSGTLAHCSPQVAEAGSLAMIPELTSLPKRTPSCPLCRSRPTGCWLTCAPWRPPAAACCLTLCTQASAADAEGRWGWQQ